MSKSCSWITNNTGEVIGALTEDGKKSKLFESLLKQYDVQQAQDLYEASRSDAFKEIYGEVTTLSFEDFVESKSDFRDAHSAPSKDDNQTEDKLDSGGDFSLLEVSKGFHNQPDDYFDPQVGARYYGYNTKEGKQSFTAISNIIRGVKTGKENQTITTYRAVPKGVDVDTLQDYDWVSFSKDYTKSHGNSRFGLKEFKIIEQEVPITDLWWDGNDINEWGYDTGNTEKLSRRDLKNLWDNMQEATPEQVVRFVTEENQSKRELSAEQKVAVRNFGVANTENLKERLLDAFYDNEGVFFVSESKLIKSGLYSAYEASNLKNDISLQEKVKSALEAFKNTSDVYSEDISDDQVDKINTFNSFGKLVKVKKQVEPLQSVETFQEIDGQLVEEPVDNVDLLLSYKSAEENQELEDDLNVLLTVSDEVLLRNEATKTVLENVERLAIADGLDLIGLADKQFDRPFMQSLLNFVISPNKENTANFSQEYKRLFQKNSEVKLTGLNREVDNKEYVVVNTTLSEQEVYKQKGFIKVEDNLYIKTNSQPLEELYEVVRTYTEKYPKEMTLEQYVQQETGKLQGFTNPEIAEAVVLYKMYFNLNNQENEQLSQTENFKTNRGGKNATDATNFLRSESRTNEKNSSDRQKTKLENFAKTNKIWVEDYKKLGEYIGKGMESEVFLSKDGSKVFKVNDLEFYDTPLDYLNTINKQNELFPEASYNLIGFTRRGDTGNFAFIVEQSFIEAERGATQQEVNTELEKLGFLVVGEAESYKKDNVELLDLHEGNVVVDKKGNLFFIDPVIFVEEVGQAPKKEVKQDTSNFTGNYEYLTEDFPADFYKEMLAEKKKDSVKYNNYYVHFGIDEKGIYLNEVDSNTLENIKDFADENMKQYSVISKRIPNIAEQTEEVFSTEQTRRDEAINNPNSVEKFTGEYVKTASDNVIAKNTQKEFIKVENEIYELWDDLGNLSMYTKVASNNSPYFAVNTKKTGTNEDLNSYTHLLTTPEKFINYKKNNDIEGFEC